MRFVFRLLRGVLVFIGASLHAISYTRRHPDDMSVSFRYARELSEGFRRVFGLDYVIRNEERLLASQPCVYICNHRSNLDVVTVAEVFRPGTVVIGKASIRRIPFFGRIWVSSRNISIDRSDHDDSRAGMEAAERAIADERLSVFVFPEGTRDFGRLRPFKKGAFHLARNAGVRLQPLVVAVPSGWFVGMHLFVQKRTKVLVDVLEPINPVDFESVEDLLSFAEQTMGAALGRLELELD